MPWCEECNRYFAADNADSPPQCPRCGRAAEPAEPELGAPWHFKLLLVAAVVYLGYRAVQGIAWIVDHV